MGFWLWALLIITSMIQANEGGKWGGILNAGQQPNSWKYRVDHLNTTALDSPTLGLDAPDDDTSWEPPAFKKALDDFDDLKYDVKHYLSSNDEHLSFVGTIYTIGGLAMHAAQKGWKSYDENYSDLVILLTNKAIQNRELALNTIRCVLRRADNQIKEITSLMYDEWIQYSCKMQPDSCDAVILSHIKICSGPEIERESFLLLSLGDMAATYLNSNLIMNKPPEEIATQLIKYKDMFRHLVYMTLKVLKAVYPKGVIHLNC